ncbi:MAG: GMC family oxidoreductase [Vicinamibacterales bacterium]
MPTHDSDVCIIGGGISAAMLARKLVTLRPGLRVTIVEAGRSLFDVENRPRYRDRAQVYGEHPWRNDYIEDQQADGIISMTMAVGGLALHWGGACNRFSVEDLRLKSMFGLATDWPIEWDDLERHYVEAERALNVAGEPSAYSEDARTAPYPQPPVPLSYNLQVLKGWAEQSGLRFNALPLARNLTPHDGRGACCVFDTCDICPTGARYSPDFTFRQLIDQGQIVLHDRTLVRRLELAEDRPVVAAATGVHRDRPDETQEYRARAFVVASGYCWTSHLLLLSANSRFPNGLANRSGLVGRYMTGHTFTEGRVRIDDQTFPGQHRVHSLISREYFPCCLTDRPFIRVDTRVWEDSAGREARLKDDGGWLLLGDEVFDDWRARTTGSSVRLRTYLDVHPSADSRLTLNPASKNRYGDPMPRIEHRFDEATTARLAANRQHARDLFARMARASNGTVVRTFDGDYLDHPAGGCRMGTDPASVCDSYGRTHDHDNLFVVGAPTLPTGGCTNGTLTFVALTLRSATQIAASLARG